MSEIKPRSKVRFPSIPDCIGTVTETSGDVAYVFWPIGGWKGEGHVRKERMFNLEVVEP